MAYSIPTFERATMLHLASAPPSLDPQVAPSPRSGEVQVVAPDRRAPVLESRALRALLLALAYYVGARIAFIFQSPTEPQSILWLPNSILLAVLLLSAPRDWPLYLLAGYPAQLLVSLSAHAVGPMSLLYVTNCADALLGAVLVRKLSPGAIRFHELKSTVVFLVFGATLAPLLVSFADAAITVITHWGNSYWDAFSLRARANVLTNIILVPTIVSSTRGCPLSSTASYRKQFAEAFGLMAGIVLISLIVFLHQDAMSVPALLFLLLPFLFWATLRFGPPINGAALFVIAIISSWCAVRGLGPFTGKPPADNIMSLQLLLLAISVPLVLLSAVVEDRATTVRELQRSQDRLTASLQQASQLTGRLLSAQEAERSRIARELHDDLTQQLAALAIGLSDIKRRFVGSPGATQHIVNLQEQTSTLAEALRTLSHEVHPAVLKHAGLVVALRGACEEFERKHAVRTRLRTDGDIGRTSNDVSLCLYRVAQEALRNVAAHAAARHVHVDVTAMPHQIELRVTDDGRGFDPAAARSRGGLGLTSIEERVRLNHGVVRLRTAPGSGTVLIVTVPVRDLL